MFGMGAIGDDLEEARVAADAADVLGRPGAGTSDAGGGAGRGIDRDQPLKGDAVLPVVAEVVEVEEALIRPALTAKIDASRCLVKTWRDIAAGRVDLGACAMAKRVFSRALKNSMPLNHEKRAVSHGCSPVPIVAAKGPYSLIVTAKMNDVGIRRLGSRTSSHGSPTIPPTGSTSCCRGTGVGRPL
jgi:hypothetical protein